MVALVVGVTLLSLATAALSWWRFTTSTARAPSSSPAACCPARCAPSPTTGSAASRSRRLSCTGCSGWCGCASTRPPGRCPARRRNSSSTASPSPRATGCAPPSSPTGRPGPRGRRRRPRARRGGVRPLRQPLAALRPPGWQLPRPPAGRGRRTVPARPGTAREPAARPGRDRPRQRPGAPPRRRRSGPAAARRLGRGRRRRQLGLPAGAAWRVLIAVARAGHAPAHRAGDRPDPRRHRGRGGRLRLVRAARVNALVTGLGTPPAVVSCCRSARAPRPGH